MVFFEYETLVLSPEPETLDEEEERGDADGSGPLNTRVGKEARNLRGGKDSLEGEAIE